MFDMERLVTRGPSMLERWVFEPHFGSNFQSVPPFASSHGGLRPGARQDIGNSAPLQWTTLMDAKSDRKWEPKDDHPKNPSQISLHKFPLTNFPSQVSLQKFHTCEASRGCVLGPRSTGLAFAFVLVLPKVCCDAGRRACAHCVWSRCGR